jgi:hypothetical protein
MLPRLLVALVAIMAAYAHVHVRGQAMDESHAKAAFVRNVLAFVEWPESALGQNAPIEIAVLGRPSGEEPEVLVVSPWSARSLLRQQPLDLVHYFIHAPDREVERLIRRHVHAGVLQ